MFCRRLPFATLLVVTTFLQLVSCLVLAGQLPGNQRLRAGVREMASLITLSSETVKALVLRTQGGSPEGFSLSAVPLKTLSIVLVAHNEQEYLQRTVDSIIQNTNPRLLHEIILVDDASEPPMISAINQGGLSEGLFRVIRHDERQGLILARQHGGNRATGEIIVFLDCHVKPLKNWELPIIRHLNANFRRVAVPAIPTLDANTWKENLNAVGYKMMFEWNFAFHWFEDGSDWVPCMSGGLYAITQRWWHESGEYDPGMLAWGAENIEQSIRLWLCGGEIVVARDSKIAHAFRKSFPYKLNNTQVTVNKVRTVETWFDAYKERYYESVPSARRHVSSMGDISERLALKDRMKCQPFESYVDRFRDVFEFRGLIDTPTFYLTPSEGTCIVPANVVTTIQRQWKEGKVTETGDGDWSTFLQTVREDGKRLPKRGLLVAPCPPSGSAYENHFRYRLAGPQFTHIEHIADKLCLEVLGGVVDVKNCYYLTVREDETSIKKQLHLRPQRVFTTFIYLEVFICIAPFYYLTTSTTANYFDHPYQALLVDDTLLIDHYCVRTRPYNSSSRTYPAVELDDCTGDGLRVVRAGMKLTKYKRR
ncbi:MAG: hypothetical protein KVP17_000220 [Porospora cf. gigantea B]|uniref:uncharacterized protein n=1 Tax=Porospora cf. gigantea B TaxID=2853592 RepID=UPI003571E981|nr:MAG: hypothetical protein KVP17_000220 [Porospora cf. gigantea B]